jgi:hypothetical protein
MWIGQVLPGRFDVRKRLSGRKLLHDTVYKDGVFGGVLVPGRFDVTDSLSIDTGKWSEMGKPRNGLYDDGLYNNWIILYRWSRDCMCIFMYRVYIRINRVYG